MNLIDLFNPRKTLKLFGLENEFDFLKNLLLKEKLPKVLLLSGKKGSGKYTLIHHLMFFFFDRKNYDSNSRQIIDKNSTYLQLVENIFPNIIYLNGSDYKNAKIENIRELKKQLLKSSMSNKKRFVILDDVECFNNNSLNALLKIIEEPSEKNYFILINNNSKPILETIKSRCLEVKIILSNIDKEKIKTSLLDYFDQTLILNNNSLDISPGNFLKFNYIITQQDIHLEEGYIVNLSIILDLFKKEKDINYRDLLLFLTEYYFNSIKSNKMTNYYDLIEKRSYIIKNINDFFLYNMNQKTLINSIESKLLNE